MRLGGSARREASAHSALAVLLKIRCRHDADKDTFMIQIRCVLGISKYKMPMTPSMPSQSAAIPSASLTTDCASSPDAFIASMTRDDIVSDEGGGGSVAEDDGFGKLG